MVGEKILQALASSSTQTAVVFTDYSQLSEKLYVARNDGDVVECSWLGGFSVYAATKPIIFSEDVGKTIDIFIGTTPPLREKLRELFGIGAIAALLGGSRDVGEGNVASATNKWASGNCSSRCKRLWRLGVDLLLRYGDGIYGVLPRHSCAHSNGYWGLPSKRTDVLDHYRLRAGESRQRSCDFVECHRQHDRCISSCFGRTQKLYSSNTNRKAKKYSLIAPPLRKEVCYA